MTAVVRFGFVQIEIVEPRSANVWRRFVA